MRNYLDGTIVNDQDVTYTRFWHGQASLAAAALTVLPLDGYRALLLIITLALIGLTAVLAALKDPKLLVGLAPLLVLSFVLDGQMGYGQLVSYAPAQIACWAMAAFLIVQRDRLTTRHIILLAVLAGCLEAFLDQMISIPLVAGIFLVVVAAVSVPRWRSQAFFTTVAEAASFGVAWAFGLVGTYVAKLTLTTAVLG